MVATEPIRFHDDKGAFIQTSAILLFLTFISPFASAQSSAVREKMLWDKSLIYYQKEDFPRAKGALLNLVRLNPKKSIYWFNLGNAYFMMKDYGRAITAYLKVEALMSPLTPAAKLYRAKALQARGEREAARSVLQKLMSKPGLPPALAEEASKDLMAELTGDTITEEALANYRSGKYARALRLLNRVRAPNENQLLLKALILIKLDRDDRAFEILTELESAPEMRGLIATLLDRIRDTYSRPYWLFLEGAAGVERGPLAVADLGGGIRMWHDNLWYLNSGYALRTRQTPEHPEERVLVHELRANLGRELGSELLLVSPFFSHETWGDEGARTSFGAIVRTRMGRPALELGMEAELSADSGLTEDYKYLNGSQQRYSLIASRMVAPYFWRIQLSYLRSDIGDQVYNSGDVLPAAFRGWSPEFRFLWRLQSGLVLEASAYFVQRDYPTWSQPNSIRRKDQQWTVGARVTRIFSNRFSAYLSWAQDRNTSTMDANATDNQNYNRTQVLTGVIWDVL